MRARRWPLYAGTLVAVACAALVIGTTNLGRQDEVRTKGAAPADAQRWAGIRLYRVAAAEAPRPIDGNVGSRDGVLVSYTNLGPQPFDYLMVFAVDADKQVRWLYPAWERASEDPTAIAVRKGDPDFLSFLNTWLDIQREQGWAQERARYWATSQEGRK